jgi:hypothetical protein
MSRDAMLLLGGPVFNEAGVRHCQEIGPYCSEQPELAGQTQRLARLWRWLGFGPDNSAFS